MVLYDSSKILPKQLAQFDLNIGSFNVNTQTPWKSIKERIIFVYLFIQ